MITALYDSQDRIVRIISGPTHVRDNGGTKWQDRRKPVGTKRERPAPRKATMYTVEWTPSIICENHIEHYRKVGYIPKLISPLPTDLQDMTPSDNHAVRGLLKILGPDMQSSLRKVTWEHKSEPSSNMEERKDWDKLFNDYTCHRVTEENNVARTRMQLGPNDDHLTNTQKQGIWHDSTHLDPTQLDKCGKFAHFDHRPRNPDLDVSAINDPSNGEWSHRGPKLAPKMIQPLFIIQPENVSEASPSKGWPC